MCYIVFEKSSSVNNIMSIEADEKLILMGEDSVIPFGLPSKYTFIFITVPRDTPMSVIVLHITS